MTNPAAYPSDADILAIVTKRGIRNVLYWGMATGIVALLGQAFLAVPLAIFLFLWGLWCAVGIFLSLLMALGRLFGLKPEEPYDAPRMFAAGVVRLIEGAFYVVYSILLYRLVIS